MELQEGKKWDAVKAHVKRNKKKYLLGAAAAAGLGGLEAYGYARESGQARKFVKEYKKAEDDMQSVKNRFGQKDYDKNVSKVFSKAHEHKNNAIKYNKLRPSTYLQKFTNQLTS